MQWRARKVRECIVVFLGVNRSINRTDFNSNNDNSQHAIEHTEFSTNETVSRKQCNSIYCQFQFQTIVMRDEIKSDLRFPQAI